MKREMEKMGGNKEKEAIEEKGEGMGEPEKGKVGGEGRGNLDPINGAGGN